MSKDTFDKIPRKFIVGHNKSKSKARLRDAGGNDLKVVGNFRLKIEIRQTSRA